MVSRRSHHDPRTLVPPAVESRFRGCTRRDLFRLVAVGVVGSVATPGEVAERSASVAQPVEIGVGPQLFLDDRLVERLESPERRAETPEPLESPVLDSKTFGCTQPYLTVAHDGQRQRFRLWYNHGPAVWHAESVDGGAG